jgi:hypothetical protein
MTGAYISAADGSIIPIIITDHIARSIAVCGVSQTVVIIQAEGPVMAPYISGAIGTIHAQQRSVMATSAATRISRSRPRYGFNDG